jgi:NADH-quinone oxidoreductase subunit A
MMQFELVLPIFLFLACVLALAAILLGMSRFFNPKRAGAVNRMPYESGMDPVHDTRRRFDVRFHLMAIAFLVFDVELLFLYPWAVAFRPAGATTSLRSAPGASGSAESTIGQAGQGLPAAFSGHRDMVFAGAMLFIGVLVLGYVYDWQKGVFRWQ